MKFKVLWHEPSNTLAIMDNETRGLPLITICDDETKMVNPFHSYPLSFLVDYYGWHVIGEL